VDISRQTDRKRYDPLYVIATLAVWLMIVRAALAYFVE
jgi:hypothetical protein